MDFEKLEELDRKENPEKYENSEISEMGLENVEEKPKKTVKKEYKEEIVQTVGYITDYRKIVTKTGKNMGFLKCEGFDFDFEVVVFPKDIEKYEEKLAPHQIVIITGALDINFEYKRKSIRAKDLKIASISMVREQAKDLGIFDGSRRFINTSLNEIIEEEQISESIPSILKEKEIDKCSILPENFEENLEKKILENKSPHPKSFSFEGEGLGSLIKKFIIQIPNFAKKEDLLVLKKFLENEEKGEIEIILDLRGQKKSTNIFLKDLDNLKSWMKNIWG